MKLWMAAAPNAFNSHEAFVQISGGAICPLRTVEMVQDNMDWYEVEVLRKMETKVIGVWGGYK
jgi:hypothetical protein